jgi:cytochrome c
MFSSNAVEIMYNALTGVSEHEGNAKVDVNDAVADVVSAPTVEEVKNFDIPALLRVADAENGEKISKKCTSCHSFGKDQPNRVGPNLYGILGNKIAHADGFNYSAAVKGHGGNWDYQSIFHWINNPKKFIPGNRMAFGGISNEKDIADLVAYLRKMSDNPPAFE